MDLEGLFRTIEREADAIGIRPPKLTIYANCVGVAFRNGDGERVLLTFPHDAASSLVKSKLEAAFKIKAANLPTEETLAKLA